MITQKQVKNIFRYENGVLYWKKPTSTRIKSGSKAGCINSNGYMRMGLNGKDIYNHQVIFLYFNGYIPDNIDHIDGNPLNNNIENLRECNQTQNLYNKSMQINNTSGVKGVHWRKDTKKWVAKIQVKGKCIVLGNFLDLEFAELVINEARKLYHGKFARSY